MPLFNKTEKPSGVVFENMPENERKNLIYLVDIPPKKKKKSSGVLEILLGHDPGEPKSAITLDKVTVHLRKIESIPDNEPINLFIHTLGGSSIACELLAKALLNHPGRIRVFIPQYAFSAGTMIALAADEIYMTKNAVLGPVDPQAMDLPVNSIMDSLNENADKKGFIASFMRSYVTKVKEDYDRTLEKVLKARFGDAFNEELMNHFNETHHHGYPIDVAELRDIGIDVKDISVVWRDLGKGATVITECNITLPPAEPVEQPPAQPPAEPVEQLAEAEPEHLPEEGDLEKVPLDDE